MRYLIGLCYCELSRVNLALFSLCFLFNSVYITNENAAVSHYINLIIFTLPPLSASGANEILLMLNYNLTPFSCTQKNPCVSRKNPLNQTATSQASFGVLYPLSLNSIQLRYKV